MRKDAIIDGRQSGYLKNAQTGGYGKYKAQRGDVVQYRRPGDDELHTARVIGRVHYAPALGSGEDRTGPVNDWLLVLQLGYGLSHAYERWIDPDWITYCVDPRGYSDFMAYFFGPDLPMGEDGRWIAHYGALSVDHTEDDSVIHRKPGGIAAHIRAIFTRREAQLAGTWKA